MIQWGVSAMSHDASLAVIDNDELVYASHGERYSRIKNDRNLHPGQLQEALQFGNPTEVFFYENIWHKKWRQLKAGQYKLLTKQSPASYMRELGIKARVTMMPHHHSHAAYGYYTSGFENADILVIDSIGESETMTIWKGLDNVLEKVYSQHYPHSIGLWYSAMTQRLGLKPQEHEYILMGMAAFGDPDKYYDLIRRDFFICLPDPTTYRIIFKDNLHRGCAQWRPNLTSVSDYIDIAAAVQRIYEEIFTAFLSNMRSNTTNNSVVIVGGCALNCVANTDAFDYYDKVWIPPNPGDAGSAVGAILAHNKQHIVVDNAFLGTNIPGIYPVHDIIGDLKRTGISAVASGRAEFGPRALGHRSILADPRIPDIQERVNKIKQREEFRPFSPMVLQEHAAKYFNVGSDFEAPYMQYAVTANYANIYPGISHIDNTSRIQTVDKSITGPRALLEAWYKETGCPMLLNTSLNVKGEPLVNTRYDAYNWTLQHSIPVRM